MNAADALSFLQSTFACTLQDDSANHKEYYVGDDFLLSFNIDGTKVTQVTLQLR